MPPVVDPFDAIKQRKDLSYLDLPPTLCEDPAQGGRQAAEKPPSIDKKTLEEMNKATLRRPRPRNQAGGARACSAPACAAHPAQPQPIAG